MIQLLVGAVLCLGAIVGFFGFIAVMDAAVNGRPRTVVGWALLVFGVVLVSGLVLLAFYAVGAAILERASV